MVRESRRLGTSLVIIVAAGMVATTMPAAVAQPAGARRATPATSAPAVKNGQLPPRAVRPSPRVQAVKQSRGQSMSPVTTGPSAAAPAAPFKAVERVAVIAVSYTDYAFPFTVQDVQNQMATMNTWMQEVSYGKRSVVSTVVGPVISTNDSCKISPFSKVQEAVALADPSIDYRQIDSLWVIYGGCDGFQGTIGQNVLFHTQDSPSAIPMGWAVGPVGGLPSDQVWKAFAHEGGHNMGLHHADFLECGPDPIRAGDLSSSGGVVAADGCQWYERGDAFDMMGRGPQAHYDAPHKYMMGFFDPTLGNERVQDVTAPGNYTVNLLETRATNGPETKALRIPRGITGPNGDQEDLWVEYRQPVGFDGNALDPAKLDGVFIHLDNMIAGAPTRTELINPHPATTDASDPALRLGQTVYDPGANRSITLTGLTPTQATVRVEFDHALMCAPSAPTGYANVPVTFNAAGGATPFNWSAPGASPSSGTGASFSATYSAPGTHTVMLSSPNWPYSTSCSVEIVPFVCSVVMSSTVNQQALLTASGGIEPYTWSAPGSDNPSGTGTPFGTRYGTPGPKTVTVTSANSTTAQCTFEIYPAPPGEIDIARTKVNGSLLSGTSAKVDGISQAFNPAYFQNLTAGTHTASATVPAGYNAQVAQCMYVAGDAECTPSGFVPASCQAGVCSIDADIADGQIRKVEFRYMPAGWSGFVNQGGSISGTPALVKSGANQLDVFARGTDNTLRHRSIVNGVASAWENLGGSIASDPAAVSWGPGRIDVLARGTSKKLRHIAFTGSGWTAWENAGSTFAGTPTVVSNGPNHLDVYFRTTTKLLRHVIFNGTQWSSAATVKGAKRLASDPVAISWASGRVDVFWQGPGNALMHRGGAGGTTDTTEQLATNLAGKPAVASWGAGHLDAAWRGTDNRVYEVAFENTWGAVQNLGPGTMLDPAIVSRSPGDVEVFIGTADGGVSFRVYSNGWAGVFQPLGGNFVAPPVAIPSAWSRIDVVAVGADNTLSINTFQQ